MSKLKFDLQKSSINQDSFFLSTDFSFKKVLLPFAFAKVHFRFLYTTRAMFPKHDLFSGTLTKDIGKLDPSKGIVNQKLQDVII